MTPTEVEAHLETMKTPVDNQELHDQLSALVLLGKAERYVAKQVTEDGDWERARELIEEAVND